MPKQKVNDVIFDYSLLGKKQASNTIVFIAGYAIAKDFWQPIVDELKHNHQILLFENQGIDATKDDGKPLTVDIMAENIMLLIKALNLGNITLVGFAMGGGIAQRIAYVYPENIHYLILLGSVLRFNEQAKASCEQLCILRESGDLAAYAELLYDTIFSDAIKSSLTLQDFSRDFVPTIGLAQSINNQRRQLQALQLFDSSAWADNITVPTTILSPEEDYFAPLIAARCLRETIGDNAKLISIPKAGHAAFATPESKKIVIDAITMCDSRSK